MALKLVVDTLDSVPEALRGEYQEKDGKFVLAVDGAVSVDKLNEFRTTNVNLMKERDALNEKYKDIDPEKYREFTAQEQKIREKQLIEAGQVEQLFTERTATMRGAHERQLAAVVKDRDAMKGQLEGLVIDSALHEAAIKHGVAPTAIDDVLLRGRATFRLVDGKAVAMRGDTPLFGSDGSALDVPGWVASLQETAPHLFPASSGSGARGATGGASSGARIGTVNRGDNANYLANLEKIATGKMSVV